MNLILRLLLPASVLTTLAASQGCSGDSPTASNGGQAVVGGEAANAALRACPPGTQRFFGEWVPADPAHASATVKASRIRFTEDGHFSVDMTSAALETFNPIEGTFTYKTDGDQVQVVLTPTTAGVPDAFPPLHFTYVAGDRAIDFDNEPFKRANTLTCQPGTQRFTGSWRGRDTDTFQSLRLATDGRFELDATLEGKPTRLAGRYLYMTSGDAGDLELVADGNPGFTLLAGSNAFTLSQDDKTLTLTANGTVRATMTRQ